MAKVGKRKGERTWIPPMYMKLKHLGMELQEN
jgi:hypothetical protein